MNRYYIFTKSIIRFFLGLVICCAGFLISKFFGSFSNISAFICGILLFIVGLISIFEMHILQNKPHFVCCLQNIFKALASRKLEKDINKNNIKAYVINLDRSKKRWEFIKNELDKLTIPYERVTAYDGNTLLKEDLENVDDRTHKALFKKMPEPGTIGCALSHKKCWDLFLSSKDEFALILEDDVAFDPEKLEEILKELTRHKKIWDIVNFELNHHGLPVKIHKIKEHFLCAYLMNVKHAGAYFINRFAAKKLVEKFYPIKLPLDHYFTRAWEFNINFLGIEPRIVKQIFEDSEINRKNSSKSHVTPREHLINATYNIYVAIDNFFDSLSYVIASKIRQE